MRGDARALGPSRLETAALCDEVRESAGNGRETLVGFPVGDPSIILPG